MKISRRKLKVEVPTVAMGDIAFNLLIFFVILARVQDDSHLRWQPAATPKVEKFGQSKVRVTIDKEGQLYLNGQPIAPYDLKGRIETLLGDLPAGQRIVLLKVDRETQAQKFEPVIEAISDAGGELVHVLDEERKGAQPGT